jgi:chitin disaccharide deacetylase
LKRLVVTADDVGLHRGMTLGAIEAHRNGIVQACSVVACGRELEHAAGLLRDEPRLSVGVHLTLVEDKPLSPPDSIPSLVIRDTFPPTWKSVALRYSVGRIKPADVEREFRAQIERVVGAGLEPRHLNGHQHLHLLPAIFEVVLRLAREYGIRFVRTVQEPPSHRLSGRALALRVLNRLGSAAARAADRDGISHPAQTIGIAAAGHLTSEKLIELFGNVVDGVTELVCHPGIGTADLTRAYNWGYQWDRETRSLCDPAVRRALEEKQIELASI